MTFFRVDFNKNQGHISYEIKFSRPFSILEHFHTFSMLSNYFLNLKIVPNSI